MSSGSVRAESMPHVADAARLAAVEATALMDTAPEPAFDELAALAARLLRAPFAFVTLVDEERSFWKSRIGIPAGGPVQNATEESFCRYIVASGEPLVLADVTKDPLTAGNPSIEAMGVRAWAGFPLQSPEGLPLGSFCVLDTVVREWSADDVEVLRVLSAAASRELTLRAVIRDAVRANEQLELVSRQLEDANATLREAGRHDRTVAHALQDAMLTHLPEPDHLQLRVRYVTADAADQVGGDWYDAVVAQDGATTVVIGDVAGHDIAAATVMGQLRNLLRALVWDHQDDTPSELIARLDRAMTDLGITTMATLVLARIEQDPAAERAGVRSLRWSCAGHPVPVLVDSAGSPRFLDVPADPPLAVWRGVARHDHVTPIEPGETLLMFTDGLIETRDHGFDERRARLLEILTKHRSLALDELLDETLSDMVGQDRDDDIAILAVRIHPED